MTPAPSRVLRASGRVLELGGRPRLMGVVNASPDSFSDGGRNATLDQQVALAHELVAAGAELIDVGGESAATDRAPVAIEEELARVLPLIGRIATETDALVSVDTYKPVVAEAALAAGAAMVNDVSGLRDPGVAQTCARTGAALVLMHTQGAPKQKVLDHPDESVARDVTAFLGARMALAGAHGVDPEQLLLDPGLDFGKSPARTCCGCTTWRKWRISWRCGQPWKARPRSTPTCAWPRSCGGSLRGTPTPTTDPSTTVRPRAD